MSTWEEDIELLEENDWEVECESPFEIRKKDTGDFASGEAARYVLEALKEEREEELLRKSIVERLKEFGYSQLFSKKQRDYLIKILDENDDN